MTNGFVPANMPGSQTMAEPLIKCGFDRGVMEMIFTPAESGGYVPAVGDLNRVRSFSLSWWKPESFYYHSNMLVSAWYGMQYTNFRDRFQIPRENFTFFGDSGGFQIATQKVKIPTLKIQRWQEKHCDIGFTKDYPTYDVDKTDNITYRKHQDKTIEEARYFNKHRQRYDDKFKLYGVIFGRDINDFKYFANAYEDLEFDGIGVGSVADRGANPTEIAEVILMAIDAFGLKKNLHLFGRSGNTFMPVVAYIRKKYGIEGLTYDSSSYSRGSSDREYYSPVNLQYKWTFNQKRETKIQSLPCKCPVCSNVRNSEELCKDGSVPGALISLHNLYWYLHYDKMFNTLVDDDSVFRGYCETMYGLEGDVVIALDYIDYCLDKGEFITLNYYLTEGRFEAKDENHIRGDSIW